MQNRSKADTHKLNLNASADGGAIIGAVGFAAGEAITQLSKTRPEWAENVQDLVTDLRVWYALAGGMIMYQGTVNLIKSLIKRRRAVRLAANQGEKPADPPVA